MNLSPGATRKAGDEIAEVLSPEQDSIVATYMRALADIAGRTAELRIKARVAQESLEAVQPASYSSGLPPGRAICST